MKEEKRDWDGIITYKVKEEVTATRECMRVHFLFHYNIVLDLCHLISNCVEFCLMPLVMIVWR